MRQICESGAGKMRIHHFGFITDNFQGGGIFTLLGFVPEGDVVFDRERKIQVLFMKKQGIRIELVVPDGEESPFYPLLGKYKNSFYHICYETEDIRKEMIMLRGKGFVQTTRIQPAPAIGGRNVVFLLNPQIGLIELLETKK